MEASVLSLRNFSISFNSLSRDNNVMRENLIGEIEEFTKKGHKIIIVEGNEGSGKTNLLIQLSQKYNQNSFTYFINSSCSSTYKQDYLMEDIGKQLFFYIKSEIPEYHSSITEAELGKLLFELLKNNNRKSTPIYFIIDGIDQIEKSEFELLKPTLLALPWNVNNIYFIVSGESKKILNLLTNIPNNSTKTLWVTRFTFEECCKLFNVEKEEDKLYLRSIYDTWKGHPEDLKKIKSIIDGGTSIEDFVNNSEINEKDDLLEIIWNKSNLYDINFNNDVIKILSIITFNDTVQDLQKLCNIIGTDIDQIIHDIKKISFLYINDNRIFFSFKSFRNFSAKKLKKYERKVSEMLIHYYKNRKDFESIVTLPSLFDRNKEWNDVIDILSVDNFKTVIANSKSFSEIRKQINYGYKASINLSNSSVNLLNFSLYRSTAIGLQKSGNKENQIKALIAIDKPDEALSIIAATTLKEDRLKMLITYSKECKRKKIEINEVIISEIKDSLEEVEKDYIKENVIDIVIGLAYFLPEYSVKVIEKATGLRADDNSLEWLLGYVATIVKWNKDQKESDDISLTKESNDISGNEFLEKFSKSIGFGISEVKEENIIDYIRDVENLTDKVFLLRTWIKNNNNANSIDYIINFAFDTLLHSASNLKPTTTIVLDLISPLSNIKDYKKANNIIDRVEELKLIINSPTNDRIKIDALIIESLVYHNIELANTKAIDLDSFVESLSDYSLKVEALAVMWALVHNVENNEYVLIEDFILDKNLLIRNCCSM